MTTRLQRWRHHRAKWRACDRCPAMRGRRKVFGRGRIRPDVLLVGIAPGEVEEFRGVPFVGPAGRLLDHAVRQGCGGGMSFFFLNLLLCRPMDGRRRNRDPSPSEIEACRPRLREALGIVAPRRAVVRLGRVAGMWAETGGVRAVDVWHPAAVVRDRSREGWYLRRWAQILEEIRCG